MKKASRRWMDIAEEELAVADSLLDAGRYLYAGFMAQQAAEKALKAVLQETMPVPPKVHDLEVLAQEANLDDQALAGKLAALSEYYIATRYPDQREELGAKTTRQVAQGLLPTAREVCRHGRPSG
ncbi:MAG: HEPN domain-containing protein [Thermaerobacter sp.]|nr:HEPN domain-containing protein [Thermaerobacter sp.]